MKTCTLTYKGHTAQDIHENRELLDELPRSAKKAFEADIPFYVRRDGRIGWSRSPGAAAGPGYTALDSL